MDTLTRLEATRRAAAVAYWRAGIANPRDLDGLVVEAHDAFNSLLPIGLADLGLVDPGDAVEALVGDPRREPVDPLMNPITGPRGRIPTNLSGGLKARGHPVGGTGLFQIAETYLQITGRFPNPAAQVANARVGLARTQATRHQSSVPLRRGASTSRPAGVPRTPSAPAPAVAARSSRRSPASTSPPEASPLPCTWPCSPSVDAASSRSSTSPSRATSRWSRS